MKTKSEIGEGFEPMSDVTPSNKYCFNNRIEID